MNIDLCNIIDSPKGQDPCGNPTYVEGRDHIPFGIQRIYPGGSGRCGQAHKMLHQLIIAMSGSFDVALDDGKKKKRVHLSGAYGGLYVHPMIWRKRDNFSFGSVCMVLPSNKYDDDRNYGEFRGARWQA